MNPLNCDRFAVLTEDVPEYGADLTNGGVGFDRLDQQGQQVVLPSRRPTQRLKGGAYFMLVPTAADPVQLGSLLDLGFSPLP